MTPPTDTFDGPDPDPDDLDERIRRASPDDQLREDLLDSLQKDSTGNTGYQVLEAFKNAGGSMEVAYTTLDSIYPHDEDDETLEDQVSCLLDAVCGFCSWDSWIWLDVEYPFSVSLPSSISDDKTQSDKIYHWICQAGFSWCGGPGTYHFRTEADAEKLRNKWL